MFPQKASEIKHVNFIVDILVYDELKNVVQNLLLMSKLKVPLPKIRPFFLKICILKKNVLYMLKHLPWPHNTCMTKKGGRWAHKSRLTPPLFMGVSCTKPGRWAVMYLFVRGYLFLRFFYWMFGNVSTCGIFCFSF
jgi:hypothetical protein